MWHVGIFLKLHAAASCAVGLDEGVRHRHRDVHVRGPLNNQQRGQGGILAPFKNSLGTALLQGVLVEEVVLGASHQVVVLDTLDVLVTGVGVQQREPAIVYATFTSWSSTSGEERVVC